MNEQHIQTIKSILLKSSFTEKDLKNIEEIWLTNAISGIKWVAQFDQYSSLQNTPHAQTFINSLNQFFASEKQRPDN